MRLRHVLAAWFLTPMIAAAASAQVTPAAGYTPPDDTPSVKVGVTLYTDYTYTQSPQATDADGNTINPSSFNVSRSYINITGNLNHIVSFRITPDITRESGLLTLPPGGTIGNDSLIFRIKYAFGQINLDDWMTKGSWVRLGIQQTPLLDYEEGIYRYRFQGTTFTEREGFYNSADAGASFHYNFKNNYGEIHAGYYNGEGYARPEVNDRHAFDIRGTVRPFATGSPSLRGLRLTGFYVADDYVKNAPRTRAVGQVTYEPCTSTPASTRSTRTIRRPSPSPTSKPRAGRSGRRRSRRSAGRCCCATTTWLPTRPQPTRRGSGRSSVWPTGSRRRAA